MVLYEAHSNLTAALTPANPAPYLPPQLCLLHQVSAFKHFAGKTSPKVRSDIHPSPAASPTTWVSSGFVLLMWDM